MHRLKRGLFAAIAAAALAVMSTGLATAAEVPTDRPLSLEECINIALGGHPKVKSAEQDARAGLWRTRQGISAFWPQANFEATRNHVVFQRQIRLGTINLTTSADYISNDFTFNTSWRVFDFGRTYYNVKSLAEIEDSLLKNLTAAEQRVAYDVMDAYFELLKSQSLVKVAEDTLAARNKHLDQAKAFFDAGVKPKFDVTSAEVEVNDAKLDLIVRNNAVKVARASLNARLGIDHLAPVSVLEVPMPGGLEMPLEGYYEEALANRPDIQALEATLRSSEMSVKAAYADFLPEFNVSATQDWYKEDHTDVLSNQNVRVALTVPLFEGFMTTAKVGEARANLLSNRYKVEDIKLDVLLGVSTAYYGVEDSHTAVETLESSVVKARENLEIADGRYEAGVGTNIEVTDAQVALTKAETDLTTAVYSLHSAYTTLLRSIGSPVR